MSRETDGQSIAPLTFVMGVERSGTTPLLRSLARGPRLTIGMVVRYLADKFGLAQPYSEPGLRP